MDPTSSSRSVEQRRADVRDGIRIGTQYAVGFSILATVIIAVKGRGHDTGEVALLWLGVIAFYFGAGALAGAVYGLLRPVRNKLWGRLATAFLILFVVYGASSLAVWPLAAAEVPFLPYALWGLALVGAVSLIMAPVYVFMFWLRGRS